jgi:dTDP-4-amino-4,6-dideoxygalactose transaminase
MIKLCSPDIREEDLRRVSAVLKSGNLVQGKYVARFEDLLAEFTGMRHCAVVSSGTAALHLSLKAIGLSKGDGVLVPAFTFPATANTVLNAGGEVFFSDVAPGSYVVTPKRIEQAIQTHIHNNLKAVIVVHEFGFPADVRAIRKITDRYGLKLIEDAACALGTIAGDHHVGYYSDAACFSFHPRKAITTGEGGAVVSPDDHIINTIKLLRNHGISYIDNRVDFIADGLNYRMTDFQAALAIGPLGRFDAELKQRRALAASYEKILHDVPEISLPLRAKHHSWQSFMVVLDERLDRERIIQEMAENGVETNLGAQALHQLAFFKNRYGFKADDFKAASLFFRKGLVLPLYGKLSRDDIHFISQTLKGVIGGL